MLLLMMQGKYLTLEGCELVMMLLNIVLTYLNLEFRFPKKLSTFTARMNFNENVYKGIKKYVACKTCHSIYHLPETNSDRSAHSTCRFASRISSTSRLVLERCNTGLYTVSKTGKLTPTMTFIYNSIITTLQQFFSRKNFMKEINSWRKRKLQKEGYLFDIMDGDVWKSFKINENDNVPFVEASKSNLMFNFNLDWFQAYTGAQYSVGAIYMTILNIDRKSRNLRKNVIFVGLMPGPYEPHLQQINNYLKPLIDELKILMGEGIKMMTDTGEVLVRAAVTLGSLDLPAAAKSFGFTSHNATFACRKCDHAFCALVVNGTARDYSGGWDGNWKKRTKESNRQYAMMWKNAANNAERDRLVKITGTRWSAFHELPYFDMIRFPVYDPMHNIWMGTCKRIVNFIFKKRFLDSLKIEEMSVIISNIIMPFGIDVSSLTRKVDTGQDGFGHFKADEWRVYSLFLSPLLLKNRIPKINYDHWMQFVEAMQVMSLPNVSISAAKACHDKVVTFCKQFERLYGKESLYPNMHYHIHLFDQMLDYGPFHSHHAFGFERFNMDLKNIRTNHKGSIETTMAKKFVQTIHREDLFVDSIPDLGPNISTDHLKSIFLGMGFDEKRRKYEEDYLSHELEISQGDDYNLINFIKYAGSLDGSGVHDYAYGFEPLPTSTVQSLKIDNKYSLLKEDYKQLLKYYQLNFNIVGEREYIFGKDDEEVEGVKVDPKIARFKSIYILGQKYSSIEATSFRGSYIRAYYRDIVNQNSDQYELRPAQIQFFFRHTMYIMNSDNSLETVTFTFAYVRWYKDSEPGTHITTFDTINTSCYSDTFLGQSFMDILPVQCIHSPVGIYNVEIENYIVVITLPRRITE